MKRMLQTFWSYRPSTKHLLFTVLAFLLIWVVFFDSHSLYKRASWHHQLSTLKEDNTQLEKDIQLRRTQVQDGISDTVVEQIAREEYGMRKPGETVYQVQETK